MRAEEEETETSHEAVVLAKGHEANGEVDEKDTTTSINIKEQGLLPDPLRLLATNVAPLRGRSREPRNAENRDSDAENAHEETSDAVVPRQRRPRLDDRGAPVDAHDASGEAEETANSGAEFHEHDEVPLVLVLGNSR